MSQAGIISVSGGGGGGSPVQTLTGNNPVAVPPTANNINIIGAGNITVTGNAGTSTLTITDSGGGFVWTDEATSFAAVAENGYFAIAAVTGTLPAVAAQGDTIKFAVDTASNLTIRANAGQTIRLGTTTSSMAGTLTNTQRGDGITLVFRAAASTWIATDSVGGWNAA